MERTNGKNNFKHVSVMTDEVLWAFSQLPKNSTIVDGTLGRGGHSKLLLDSGFKIIGIDRDMEAIREASENLKDYKNLKISHGNFANIKDILKTFSIEKVEGILLDLGVSTYQLENSARGFGFEGELDMRMDQNQKLTAKKVVNEYPEEEIFEILKDYGEKAYPERIAQKIEESRKNITINRGEELIKIIDNALPEGYKKTRKHHWATPTFRALRIEVNKDFENLKRILTVFPDVLNKEGIFCVITFHTKEESIVRKYLRPLKQQKVIRLETKKGIEASKKEISENPKAKRAKLWIARKK